MPPLVKRDFTHPRVEIKETWSDDWEVVDYLQVLRGANYVPSVGLDYMSFRSRYGRVKLPAESTIETKDPLELDGYWVRVSAYEAPEEEGEIEGEWITMFQGRIDSQLRMPHGKMFDNPPSGVQEWTAYGGYQLLMKTEFCSHFAATGEGDIAEIKWLPKVNASPYPRSRYGNRATQEFNANNAENSHYIFWSGHEEPEPWTCKQFVDYLIARHLPQPGETGTNPTWTIGGAVEAIETIKEPFELGSITTVADAIHAAINRQYAVDFCVTPTEAGFEITVFTLANLDESYNDVEVPANANSFSIDATQLVDAVVTIEKTSSQKYRKIIVRGERLVSCGSFAFEELDRTAMIDKAWTTEAQQGYEDAAGSLPGDAEFNDRLRASGNWDAVYTTFNFYYFTTAEAPDGFFPSVDDFGFVRYEEPNVTFGYDTCKTLDWLPLRAGVDYSSLSPFGAIEELADVEPGEDTLLRPQAWVRESSSSELIPAYEAGFEIAVKPDGIGVVIKANPPHVHAKNIFAGRTLIAPKYDWRETIFTLAWQGTERLQIATTEEDIDECYGTKIIDVPDAHLWYIVEGTVYEIDRDDDTGVTPKRTQNPLIVRDDRARLERIMAGAVARYHRNRYRARIFVHGVTLWQPYLGWLIEYVNDGTEDTAELKSPITSIEWEFEQGYRSTVRTGYSE